MNLNENKIKGKWLEIKGEVRKAWGKVTDDELEKSKGDMKVISGLIQQRYGDAQETYSKKLSDIFNKFENQKDKSVDEIKKTIKQ